MGDRDAETLSIEHVETVAPKDIAVQGEQKTLVLLAYYRNTPIPSQTWDAVYDTYFNPATESVQSFFSEVSYGRVSYSGIMNPRANEGKMGDIFGWYLIDRDSYCGCGTSRVQEAMMKADEVEGPGAIPFHHYDRVVIISPWTCRAEGAASVGKQTVDTPTGTGYFSVSCVTPTGLTNPPHVPEHEMGHNLGALHSWFLRCVGGSFDGENCIMIDYGDWYDMMGQHPIGGQFNAVLREVAGWLGDEANPSSMLTISTSQSVELMPIEVQGPGTKGIKIVRTPDDYLYLEYRQPIGIDTRLYSIEDSDVFDGLLIHLRNPQSSPRSVLIDATAYYGGSQPNSALMQNYFNPFTGETYLEDPLSHIKLKVISTLRDLESPENSRITVHVQYPNCGADADQDGYFSEPECIIPGIECDDANFYVNAGETEVCDGQDLTCPCSIDHDGDGFMGNWGCDPWLWDCDDTNPEINPWAQETCNGLDDNCMGGIDESLFLDCGMDAGACEYGWRVCTAGTCGECGNEVGPTAEACGNYVDEDCDYFLDNGCGNPIDVSSCTDFDGGRNLFVRGIILNPDGESYEDYCADQYIIEWLCGIRWDGVWGITNEGHYCPSGCLEGACIVPCSTDGDGDNYFGDASCPSDTRDCDDTNPAVHPGGSEACSNGIDDDCDGNTDEGCTQGSSPGFMKARIRPQT